MCATLRLLQLLPDTQIAAGYASDAGRVDGPYMDVAGIAFNATLGHYPNLDNTTQVNFRRYAMIRAEQGDAMIPAGKTLIDYEEAMEKLSSEEAFRATIYAMNTLLIQKGFYTSEEFRFQFRQSAKKQLRRKRR